MYQYSSFFEIYDRHWHTLFDDLIGLLKIGHDVLRFDVSKWKNYMSVGIRYLKMFETLSCRYDGFDFVLDKHFLVSGGVEVSEDEVA